MPNVKLDIYQHDLYEPVVIACVKNNQPVNLTDPSIDAVNFIGRRGNEVAFKRPADEAEANGLATMRWHDGDTDDLGVLALEVEVTYTSDSTAPDGRPDTFRPKTADGSTQVFNIVADYG